MSDLVELLPRNARRGSKPRCHGLTHGAPEPVAARLTQLIAPFGAVSPDDHWMPQGFDDHEEAQLHSANRLLRHNVRKRLVSWWLAAGEGFIRTPNWDIASTCRIGGKVGLVLVEAKAHDSELIDAEAGRTELKPPISAAAEKNHIRIGKCIQDASNGLSAVTNQPWTLSRDSHYQMSNRFAWSWKLVEFGIPVILVYLGFLRADDMTDQGKPFETPAEWEALVRSHNKPLFPASVWNCEWKIDGLPFVPLIRSIEWPLIPNLES